ncbi:diguanylate cyclase [Luteimonas sp. MC1828]|uniref:sensor domain-containing diguanylate cyclase n=1 Tax=Luteimonas sp. MC1828 TaxID=2799787 RepID=UPI0018F214D8|nr:diguanylate cyclase [Luteimonas sp. MC1828]MBJ7574305.1 diguanylate cyclase [Luteimonas sp. MC1828]
MPQLPCEPTPVPQASVSRLRPYRTPAFALALALLVGVCLATVLGVRGLVESRDWVEHSYKVIAALDQVQSTLHGAEAGARGYRLAGHPGMLAEYMANMEDNERAREALVVAAADNPTQLGLARRIDALSETRIAELQRLVDIQQRDGAPAAIRAMRPAESVAAHQVFIATSTALRAEETRLLEERLGTSRRNAVLLISFVVLGLAVSLGLMIALLRSLTVENSRSRHLEAEARMAIARTECAQARAERLGAQRQKLGAYAGMLQSCQNLDEAMEATAFTLRQLVPWLGGRCYVARASRDFLETAAHFGQEAVASGDLIAPGDCWGIRRGQPHHVDGHSGGQRCAHLDHTGSLAGVSSLCVPLVAQGDTLGMLHVNAQANGNEDDNDVEMVTSVGEQLAMAIANLRLRETLRVQSLRDPLTGLFNRRYLEENLARELQRCERRNLPLSLLMIDVDNFKRFNDQHGHAAGDAVLSHVGRTLEALVRGEDLACRYGGEEFTLILPEADAATAITRAETIRRTVAMTTLLHMGQTLGPVTLSIGVASFPADGATPEVLLGLADASLYRAKAEGRDRVVHATATS